MSTLSHDRPGVHSNVFDEAPDDSPPFDADSDWWDELAEYAGEHDGDAPEPGLAALAFAEWIGVQAAWFRSEGTAAGAWLAAEIDELAVLARTLGALDPDQFDGRRDALEYGRSEDLVEAGYTRGLADGRASAPGFDCRD